MGQRVRWVAGSPISASELDAEQDYLRERQTGAHEIRVHGGPEDAGSGAVGALIRAVDRSVTTGLTALAGLKPVPVKPDQSAAANPGRRTWAVSIISDILSIGWTGGAGIAGRINGRLACDGLSGGGAVRLTRAVPMPQAPMPFRLLRAAADRKARTPETVVIELAAAADPNGAKEQQAPPQQSGARQETGPASAGAGKPTIGLRVGTADADGFVALMEVVPGRGVVTRGGKPIVGGRWIVRKPPGSEPTDEQMAQAFLRTEAGKEERKKIEQMAKELGKNGLKIGTFDQAPDGQWNIKWTLENTNNKIKLKRIGAMAALAESDPAVAPVWTQLKPPEISHLAKGGTPVEGEDRKPLPQPSRPPPKTRLLLMVVAEADYGVPVTLLTFKEAP